MTHTMVVGTTEPQDLRILEDLAVHDFTGITLGIDWRGTDPAGPPTVAWLSQSAGTVRVTDTGSMTVGKYMFRFTLTDSGGKLGFAPNLEANPNTWLVVRV